MKINTRDILLMAYDAFEGKMLGKTVLQKRIYFLADLYEYDLGYGPHYYGPYSSEVANANAELKSLGYLNESVNVYGISSHGFELARYDYSLTEDGKRFVERKKKEFPEEWEKINSAAKKIMQAGDINYFDLSIAAKAFYILGKQEGTMTLRKIKEVARKFGWSVKESDLSNAANFLEKIGLVTHS